MAEKPTLATAYIGLIPTLDGSQKAIEKELGDVNTEDAGKKAGGKFGKALGAAAAVGIGAVIAGATAVLKTGFDEALDASAGNAQLAAGIESTGNAANVSVKGLNDYASKLQLMSGQTDDSITAAQKLLLTFTNIKNAGPDKIFDKATLAATNMAAKMGGEASDHAIVLGKALNDPVKGIAALTRVGVQFTDQQKAQIKAMVAAGDTVGAQKVILGELESQFGGAAEAAGKSLPGQLEIAKRKFEDVSQTIAEQIIPVVLPALLKISDVVTQKILPAVNRFIQGFKDGTGAGGEFRKVFDRVSAVVTSVGNFIANTAVPALQNLGGWLLKNKGVVLGVVAAMGALLAVTKLHAAVMAVQAAGGIMAFIRSLNLVQSVTRVVTAVQWLWNAAMSANPIGLIVTAIAALVAGLVLFFTKTELGKQIWSALVEGFRAGWEWIKNAFKVGVQAVTAFLQGAWNFIKRVWAWSPLGLIITNWDKITAAFHVAIDTIKSVFQGIWDFIKKVWKYSPLGLIVDNWDKIQAFFEAAVDKVKDVFDSIGDAITGAFKTAFNWVASAWNNTLGKLHFTIPDIPGLPGRGKSFDFPDIPMLADGGMFTKSGVSLVGERGPELLFGKRGASVVPLSHPAAENALGGGRGGDTFNIYEQSSAEATALAIQRRQALAVA